MERHYIDVSNYYTAAIEMKESISEHQAGVALIVAGFVGVLARMLAAKEKMTIGQYIGRSVLNSFFALSAFAVYIYFPNANPLAITAIGGALAGLGAPTFELIVRRVIKK